MFLIELINSILMIPFIIIGTIFTACLAFLAIAAYVSIFLLPLAIVIYLFKKAFKD